MKKNLQYIYFIGIGGIGMSALARFFHASGIVVAGYDRTPSDLTSEMIAEGIQIHFEDSVHAVPHEFTNVINKENTLVVYTPAVPADHSELGFFNRNEYNIQKRSQVLGSISSDYFTIAVGGTHGKTTTSSIVAHIFNQSKEKCTAFVGGIMQNYDTNLILAPKSKYFVVEADEYDRSFLTLSPNISIVTSIDADHLDIYGTKEEMKESYFLFADKLNKGGTLIHKKGLPFPESTKYNTLTYSLKDKADFYASDLKVVDGVYEFDVNSAVDHIKNVRFGLPGLHNVENAIAAIAAAQTAGISSSEIKAALASYRGVKRRFEYHIRSSEMIYIDDYAHHPEELRSCISSVRSMYPDKRITGIFQPHLFSRTRDFADEFARSLELLDELILMEIYPARELPMEGVSSSMLLDKVQMKNKTLCQKENLLNEVNSHSPEVLLTLGAGDIDRFCMPLKDMLLNSSKLKSLSEN